MSAFDCGENYTSDQFRSFDNPMSIRLKNFCRNRPHPFSRANWPSSKDT
jgi:hypothetical protein